MKPQRVSHAKAFFAIKARPPAALLRVAEREGIAKIFTVDRRDFSVYRLHGRIRPALLP